MNTNASYDVLVIGGGVSGLAAAITAARAGKSVCIVERDVACGLKLLATGNGRCNLSNESIDFQRYNRPAFVESVMGPQPEQELGSFFSSLGIMTTSEEGRLYPRSLRAESVRDALLNACNHLGVTLICGANVASAFKGPEGWVLKIGRPTRALKAKKHDDRKSEVRSLRKALADTPRTNETLQAKAVIIATGGSPADIAKTFNLSLTPQRPVLCPVSASVFGDHTALKTLDGLRVRARLTLTRNHEELWHEDGEVLFRTLASRALPPLTSPVASSAETRFCSTFSPTSPKTSCSICSTSELSCSAAFHPATPAGSTACSPRSSLTLSAPHSNSATPGRTTSSIWSQSSSTLSCSSRERQRSVRPRSRAAACPSRASQLPTSA